MKIPYIRIMDIYQLLNKLAGLDVILDGKTTLSLLRNKDEIDKYNTQISTVRDELIQKYGDDGRFISPESKNWHFFENEFISAANETVDINFVTINMSDINNKGVPFNIINGLRGVIITDDLDKKTEE